MATYENDRNNAGKKSYWGGFAAGAAIGTGAAIAAVVIANMTGSRNSRIVRLEDSVQIGRPVEEVFRAWSDYENLARTMEFVNSVRVEGNTSYWDATVDGKNFKWQAETVQLVPNEAIGWKSVSGPKHSGRVTFSKIGDDTLVHVTMNYAPPVGVFSRLLSPFAEHIEGYINQCLRNFKSAMEGGASRTTGNPEKADWRDSLDRMKKTVGGVDYTRPPEYKYPTGS
jgi:uncharacterized membrane protein